MRITKTVKGKKYVTFRDYDPATKKQVDVSCGREGALAAEQKYAALEQRSIRAKIAEYRQRLAGVSGTYAGLDAGSALPQDAIINADSLKTMMDMPSNSVHMAITSPPYNVGLEYSKHEDNMTYDGYLDWLETVFRELYRILVNGGRFALNIAPTGISDFKPIHNDISERLRDMGFILRAEIVWYKQNIYKRTAWGSWKSPSNPHVLPSWEYVLVYSKGTMKLEGSQDGADITDKEFKDFSDAFWHIQPETKRNGHPAPFPEDLIYRLVKYYTYRGNTVLDMFGGTGTTALVAHKTGRRYIHIDTSVEYCETAQKRMSEYDAEMNGKLDRHIEGDLLQAKGARSDGKRRGGIKASGKKGTLRQKTGK